MWCYNFKLDFISMLIYYNGTWLILKLQFPGSFRPYFANHVSLWSPWSFPLEISLKEVPGRNGTTSGKSPGLGLMLPDAKEMRKGGLRLKRTVSRVPLIQTSSPRGILYPIKNTKTVFHSFPRNTRPLLNECLVAFVYAAPQIVYLI